MPWLVWRSTCRVVDVAVDASLDPLLTDVDFSFQLSEKVNVTDDLK